jgi:hypothetical protein
MKRDVAAQVSEMVLLPFIVFQHGVGGVIFSLSQNR